MKLHLTITKFEFSYEKVVEKKCRKCGEWLPATDEFFFRYKGKLGSPCKACQGEQRRERNQQMTCCIAGCNNPRRGDYSARCEEHQYYQRKEKRNGT